MEKFNDLIELLNEIRTTNNSPPLISNSKLEQAAESHAAYMLQYNILSHSGRNGSSFAERIKEQGYLFSTAAENIAFGATTSQEVVKLWMNSPPHKANIVNPAFTEIGVGVAPILNQSSKFNERYWSTSFAAPLATNEASPTKPETPLVAEPVQDHTNISVDP